MQATEFAGSLDSTSAVLVRKNKNLRDDKNISADELAFQITDNFSNLFYGKGSCQNLPDLRKARALYFSASKIFMETADNTVSMQTKKRRSLKRRVNF